MHYHPTNQSIKGSSILLVYPHFYLHNLLSCPLWDKHTDFWMIIKCDQCQFKAMKIEHLLELLYSSAVKMKIKWYYSPCDLGNYFTPCQFYIYKRLKMQNNKFEKLWIWRSFKVQPPTWQIKKKLWIVTFECLVLEVSEGLSLKDCLVEGSTSNPFYCFFFNLNYMLFANMFYNFSLYYNSYCIWL